MQSRKRTRININSNITPISLTSPEQSDTEKEGEDKKKHAGGRPKDPVWDYFDCIDTKHPGHYAATCKGCNHKYKMGSVNKLQIHLARECKHVDEEVKMKYMRILAEKDGLDDSLEIEVFQANTNQGTKGRLTNFWDKNEELPAERIALIDRSILKAFVVCGLPFHIIENPYFINMIKNLRSNYNPPTREILSNKLLPEETIRVELKIKNSLEQSNNLTLGIIKIIFLFNYYVYTILIFF
jgi:hypothetical protein